MKTWHAIELGEYGGKVRTRAMRDGVAACGGIVSECPDSDVATLESIARACGTLYQTLFAYTSGEHDAERDARAWLSARGIPLVVLDLGYFKRAHDSQDRTGYNQVGIGRIGWTPDDTFAVDSTRWDALGIVAPDVSNAIHAPDRTHTRPRSVLILGQVAHDSQHHLSEGELNAWYDLQSAPFRAAGCKVVFRQHPKAVTLAMPAHDRLDKGPLSDALAACGHVIAYNSTAALDAILAGLHVTCHASAHYALLAGPALPSRAMVMRHMHRLAFAQWSCAEIERGEPLRFLFASKIATLAAIRMKTFIAIPFFGANPRYRAMLDEWVAQLRRVDAQAEFVVFVPRKEEHALPYPTLELDIAPYADVIRTGQPFDVKGALMCAAALAIDRPFLMLDSDALLAVNPDAALASVTDLAGSTCAMPVDHGAILSGHSALCDAPYADVRKMCAGVFRFGGVGQRSVLVREYRRAWAEMHAADSPWTPRIPHLLEQYAWSLAHHRLRGATLPHVFNWAPHIIGASPYAVVNHYFGHSKWNGHAPANT